MKIGINNIGFKGAVVTKKSENYADKILTAYYNTPSHPINHGGNWRINLDDENTLLIWGSPDINLFTEFGEEHKKKITGERRGEKDIALAQALAGLNRLTELSTEADTETFISDQNNLTASRLTEELLDDALKTITGEKS